MNSRGRRIDTDDARLRALYERWSARRNRVMESPDYREEWRTKQCFSCRFFIPLEAPIGCDYGACTNASSPFDGRVMYEHDGCEAYEEDESYNADLDPPP